MMHPDDFNLIVRMLQIFVAAAVVVFAFKCGRAVIHLVS